MNDELMTCAVSFGHLAYTDESRPGMRSGPVLLLVHGLGQQLTAWPVSLVNGLLDSGLRVVRCDNRDVGKSSRFHGKPNTTWLYLLSQFGRTGHAPYLLDDMADDLCTLIEHLDAGTVHLVGASMGGMLCQIVAARQPFLVRSLTSIMSSSGDHRLPRPRADVLRHITHPPTRPTREVELAYGVRTLELIGSPRYPTARNMIEQRVRVDLERGQPDAGGVERQFAAVLASGSRVPLLQQITVPTLVIHGDADPLVPLEAGRHVYEHVPGARLEVIEGMGHDFPEALCAKLAGLISRHVEDTQAAHSLAGART